MAAVALLEQLARQHPRLHLTPALSPAPAPSRWSFAALTGRIVELSCGEDSAALSIALALLAQAQAAEEPVAWIAGREGAFHPPDAVTHGVDLAALAVVRVPEALQVPLAAARLAHSGAFGLLVLDLAGVAQVPDALLGRLVKQAQRHEALVLCLTHKAGTAPSLGSLVAVRAQALRRRSGPDRFVCTVEVLKDKRRGGGWTHEEVLHGVPGLH